MIDSITIKPINSDEWLPDRCLTGSEPFDPICHLPASGCPSMNFTKKHNRDSLEQLYNFTINKYGGCGFVAWHNNKVVAYHNFFPLDIKFYGSGFDSMQSDKTLVHNCLTIVGGNYLRQGICTALVKASINWAKINGWKRFETHMVLPDCEKGWQSDQKSCLTFWKQLGFSIYKEYAADKKIEEYYGVTKNYSMHLSLE